ncbi:hypothetical protein GDO81_019923 [Engystomops pustulosus]|uniref:Ig-like domain-containing protein n=2 Tax=Engystomops pustulosus TaxID=76066 RepID=A0AAV6Z9X7_ENGPU|nr:hypothetical protein GDO81_019923 [Engystomops pustulosus]
MKSFGRPSKKNKKIKLDTIRVDEGESLTLKCSVESDLELNVTWKDEKNNVLQHGIVKELELRLDNITINQTDVYTCSALTDYVINTTSISVIVPYPPRNMEISISSKDLPASHHVNIREAETLTLVCRVEGNPLVNVIWVKGKTDVEAPKASNIGSPAMINVTFSEADVYRCFAWNVNGFKEKRIHVDKIKDDPVKIAEQTASGFTISYLNVLIGFICGIAIAVLFILLYKLIGRKKHSKNKEYMKAVEPSANGDPTADDIYMNVSEPEHKDEEATDSNGQLDANGVAPDQEEELHYSTIAFTAKPNKVPSSQPESDYAQIQKQ